MAALTVSGRVPTVPADASLEESADEYVVRLAVPGFAVDDLDVEVVDHAVTIRGARMRGDLGAFHLRDNLEEWLELPADVDADGVSASYSREVLELHAPRLRDGCPAPRKVVISRPFAVNADASGV
jgi:HSP20 family molecular chaperone IbpA